MEREKLQGLADRENWRKKRKIAAGVLVVSVVVFLGAVVLRSSGPLDISPEEKENSSQQELTQYQRAYVDCPPKYLELCTEMSQIPTEPVKFLKAEDGKLYLEMPRSDRTLIARIKKGGSGGYLIRIKG